MSRTSTLITLGILILIAPFSGLPMELRSLIIVVCGAAVLTIGLMQRAREAKAIPPPSDTSAPPAPSGVSPI